MTCACGHLQAEHEIEVITSEPRNWKSGPCRHCDCTEWVAQGGEKSTVGRPAVRAEPRSELRRKGAMSGTCPICGQPFSGAGESGDGKRRWEIYEHKKDHGISGDGPMLGEGERVVVVPESELREAEIAEENANTIIRQIAARLGDSRCELREVIEQRDYARSCLEASSRNEMSFDEEEANYRQRVIGLEKALSVARDDLFKAANQFAGLMPEGENQHTFAEKAKRAHAALMVVG